MSNPVFNRIDKDIRSGYAGFGSGPHPPQNPQNSPPGYDQPRYGQQSGQQQHGQPHYGQQTRPGDGPPPPMTPGQLNDMYRQPSAGPVQMGRVTIDDVVMKTTTLFSIMLLTAAVSWFMVPVDPGLAGVLLLGSIVGTLGLGLFIAFKKSISVPLIVTYAAVEGVLVGTVSRFYEARWDGIVMTAVVATLSVFAGMLLGYRSGFIKVTSKSRRIFSMAILGYFIFALVNLGFGMFGANGGFGIFARGSTMGILVSLLAVGLASYALAMDFDSIQQAVRSEVPQKYSWLLAHGLIVTLVWLYLEMLRLISQFSGND